jgi:hypothetical protein
VIASAHIVAGVAIGAAGATFLRWKPGRVVAAFGLGVLAHLFMDAIPHADYNGVVGPRLVAIVAVESLAMIGLLILLLRDRVQAGWWPAIVAGVLGSTVPDTKFFAPLLIPGPYGQKVSDIGEQLHVSIHAEPTSLRVGMTTQLSAIVILLLILAAFPRKRQP